MASDGFKIGQIYNFNYLWSREALVGEESGRKDRPACIIFRLTTEPDILLIYPLTTKQPASDRLALEVPEIELHLAGLKKRCWLIVDEANSVHLSMTYDFASLVPVGRFSAAFVAQVQQLAQTAVRTRRFSQVKRT